MPRRVRGARARTQAPESPAGRQEGAEALLRAGAAVNAATTRGETETPLGIARASDARAVAAVLLRHGARDSG